MADEKPYVLGTGLDELQRLGLQHRIWADVAVKSWKLAGISPGQSVLDLGCGPGHATFDLAQLVSDEGHLLAVDESDSFVRNLNQQAASRSLPQVTAVQGDAENLGALKSNKKFDAVFCRWVLCWLKHPEKAIGGVREKLKPKGRFIIHDYFNWKAMTTAPRSVAIEKMVRAAVESFEERNGNVDIVADLPRLLRVNGFQVLHFEVHQRASRGGGLDSTIAWPLTWWRTYGPKLHQLGKLSDQDMEQIFQDLNLVEKDPDRFFFCPPLFEIIAEKISD